MTNSLTNLPSPEQVQTTINAWTGVAVLVGAIVWHLILKIIPIVKAVAPWAKANGGLIRGVRDFFWEPDSLYSLKPPLTEEKTIQQAIKSSPAAPQPTIEP